MLLAILLYILLLLVSLAAIALNIVSLPGNWLMLLAAALVSWYSGWTAPSLWALALMIVILLAGEALELLGSMVGAKQFGASKTATWAAIAGAVLGAIIGVPVPVIGSILGAILGAFLAAWSVELIKRKPFKHATWAAVGAAVGRVMGMGAKLACGLVVWLALAWAAFPA